VADPLDFIVTRHAVDRLLERNPEFAATVDPTLGQALKLKATYEYIASAKEEKSFLNNSIFMTMLGEKYGFENCYKMFVRDNSVFVGVSNERGRFIVTTMTRDGHYLAHIRHKVQKFQKKEGVKLPSYFPPGRR